MRRVPAIDGSRCTDCDSCIALCPEIFRRNPQTGLMEVLDHPEYPEEDVDKAIRYCPADCIAWEEE